MPACCCESADTDERKKDHNYEKGMQTIACCNTSPGNVCWTFYEMFCSGCKSRGGDSYMKQTGMLVVSLRGVNFGFWSRLGCSGQSADILSRQDLA